MQLKRLYDKLTKKYKSLRLFPSPRKKILMYALID